MLKCNGCETTSTGSAWHWIALLRTIPGGAEAVCYCPSCGESRFAYFSKRRAARLALQDDLES